MLNKMMPSVEMNMSFMFQYIVLLQYSKMQYAALIKTTLQLRVLGSVIIYRVYKLNLIIQQVIKFSMFLCSQQKYRTIRRKI